MQTQCSAQQFEFEALEGRAVVAAFDGGAVSSNAGALLLAGLDRGLGMIKRFAGCFEDRRDPDLIEHSVATLVGQRVLGIALGYEDLIDHDQLRHDPLWAAALGKLEPERRGTLASELLASQEELGRDAREYLLMAGMTGHIAAGNPQRAKELWNKYEDQIRGAGRPVFRLLRCHAERGDDAACAAAFAA